MNIDTCRAALEKRFRDRWGDYSPVHWPNTKFSVPKDKAWLRFSIIFGARTQAAMAGAKNLYRQVGIVTVQIFVPVGQGSGASTRLVDRVGEIWQDNRVDGAVMRASEPLVVGETGDGWYQVNVTTPFYWDEER